MCKSIPGTQKHMTMDQRIIIEKGLDQGSSIRSIALQLGKDPSHYHHFKWWFELALIRAGYMLAQKGGYRKHCYWSAIKRYFLNLLFLTLLPALLYISLLPLL